MKGDRMSLKLKNTPKYKLIIALLSVYTLASTVFNVNLYMSLTEAHKTSQEVSDKMEILTKQKAHEIKVFEGRILDLEDENVEIRESNDDLINKIKNLQESIDSKNEKIDNKNTEIERLNEQLTSRAGSNTSSSGKGEWMNFEMTSYTAFCSTGCNGITATGVDVSNSIYHQGKRVIAVDPSVIPLNSTVEIKRENGETFQAVAIDTGGRINGRIADLLVGSKRKAIQNGRESVHIRIMN